MQPDRCMYLHLEESEHSGTQDLVLTAQGRNIFLSHKNQHDKTQQWWYNGNTAEIHNEGERDNILGGEHASNHLINAHVDDHDIYRTRWYYHPTQHTLSTEIEDSTMDDVVSGSAQLKDGEQVIIAPRNVAEQSNWAHNIRIEYCSHAY